MNAKLPRRGFLASSLVGGAVGAAGAVGVSAMARLAEAAPPAQTQRQFYELGLYQMGPGGMVQKADDYFQHALVPALPRRHGTGRSVRRVEQARGAGGLRSDSARGPGFRPVRPDRVENDAEYQKTAGFSGDPAERAGISQSRARLMVAADFMPALAAPAPKESRIFELRRYRNPSEAAFRKKLEMFGTGELTIFRRVGSIPSSSERCCSAPTCSTSPTCSPSRMRPRGKHWALRQRSRLAKAPRQAGLHRSRDHRQHQQPDPQAGDLFADLTLQCRDAIGGGQADPCQIVIRRVSEAQRRHPLADAAGYYCTVNDPGSARRAMRGGALLARQIVGRVDQADVREGLGKVADQPLGLWVVLLGQQADVVARSSSREISARLRRGGRAGRDCRPARRCRPETPLRPAAGRRRPRVGAIAAHETVAGSARAGSPRRCLAPAGRSAGKKPDQRNHQQAGVELLASRSTARSVLRLRRSLCWQTSSWICSRSCRQCSAGPSQIEMLRPTLIARSTATQAMTLEWVKCRRGPRTSQMPSSGSLPGRSR